MLHIIEEGGRNLSGVEIEKILQHRGWQYAEENQKDLSELTLQDSLDGHGTFYIAYTHKRYGFMGSARMVPIQKLFKAPFPFASLKIKQGYVLMDCVFYMTQDNELFDNSDEVITATYECLFEDFYSSVTQSLEKFVIEHPHLSLFFCLTDEALECLQSQTARRYKALGSVRPLSEEDQTLYWGRIFTEDLKEGASTHP